MTLPSVQQIVAVHEQKRGSEVGQSQSALFQQYGLQPLIPLLVAAFPQVRSGYGRHSILFWFARFARQRTDVVQLAISALQDRAYLVRSEACAILAYSLQPKAVPHLSLLLNHKNAKTRADAAAAIDAITQKNHHYYVDREHTGTTFWEVGLLA
jgi:hypothetical protein